MNRIALLADRKLFGLALALSLIGIVIIYDAGYARSIRDGNGNIPREFYMQLMFLASSVIIGGSIAVVRIQKWQRMAIGLMGLTFALLIAVLLPGLGKEMGGAHRWLNLPIPVQPAEFAKVGVIIFLAAVFAKWKPWRQPRTRTNAEWLDRVMIPRISRSWPAVIVMAAAFIIEREPDLGTALVVIAILTGMLFICGVQRSSFVAFIALLVVGLGGMMLLEPYRLERIQAHGDRWSSTNVDDIGYQTVQSELAQASGGILGQGLGNGRAKHMLPAATTDFVMATVGEEFGLVGSLTVLGLLGWLSFHLLALSRRATDKFPRFILAGTAFWIAFQTGVNIMMANGFLFPIGIPMPFISSGGSSLLALWMAIGLCQSAVLAPQTVKGGSENEDHRYRRWDRRSRLSRA